MPFYLNELAKQTCIAHLHDGEEAINDLNPPLRRQAEKIPSFRIGHSEHQSFRI